MSFETALSIVRELAERKAEQDRANRQFNIAITETEREELEALRKRLGCNNREMTMAMARAFAALLDETERQLIEVPDAVFDAALREIERHD